MCEDIVSRRVLVEAIHHLSIVAFIVMLLVCAPLSYWILGRPFDKQLNDGAKAGPDFSFGWLSTLYLRPITYAAKIVMQTQRSIENVQRSDFTPFVIERQNYRDFNFKKNATTLQKFFSYIYIGTMLTILIVLAPPIAFCDL